MTQLTVAGDIIDRGELDSDPFTRMRMVFVGFSVNNRLEACRRKMRN